MKVKRTKIFLRKHNRMLNVVFCVFVLTFIILGWRIFFIQQTKGEEYTEASMAQQNFSNVTIPYRRGNITDRNGTLLATSEKVYNLVFDCKLLNQKLNQQYVDPTIKALCSSFEELDEETLKQTLTEKKDSSYVVLLKKQNYEQVKKLQAILDDREKNPDVKGIWLEEEYQRIYPYETLACDLLGFVTADDVGTYGIEESYNKELNGINGRKYQYMNDDSEQETVVKKATDGYNITSTIDYNVQSIVEKYIQQFNDAHMNEVRPGNGAENIGVILQDPNSGEILAEANYPKFNLNDPQNIVSAGAVTTEEYNALSEADQMARKQTIWRNFCLNDSFEPGSTQKPFTVAAGLETGKLDQNATFECDGGELVGGRTIRCVNRSGHGHETIAQALMNSCNDALMQIGAMEGVDTFTKYQSVFGFGKKTNIDLPGEANCANLIASKDKMGPVELATYSFGQGFNVTMTQQMSAFCSLINGGFYYRPHVMKKVTDSNGATVRTMDTSLVRKTVSTETSEIVKDYLYQTVMNGTAKKALVEGYTMGGKTGTAERLPRGNKQYVVSFIGYVPADHPQLAIYVVIDRPNVADQAHSSFAQEIAHDILTEVLPYMNIYPQTADTTTTSETPVVDETQQPDNINPETGVAEGENGSVFDDAQEGQ